MDPKARRTRARPAAEVLFPKAVKGLWDWDAKHERCQEKSSATLILACPSNLSLGLCSSSYEPAGAGGSWGYPSRLGQETLRDMGPAQPAAALSSSSSSRLMEIPSRVVSLPASRSSASAGHLPTPRHSAATLAQGAQRYPRLCPYKGGCFGTVSPCSASNSAKPHPVPKTSA